MKKKAFSLILAVLMLIALGAGCTNDVPTANAPAAPAANASAAAPTTNAPEGGSAESFGRLENVTLCLADSSDYYIGTMVGARVAEAFQQAGANVDILDGASQINTQIQQIQNAVTKGSQIIYIFPIGDATAYYDTLVSARNSGAKIMVSNNDPGEGAFDVYVGSEEFYMGAMQAAMVTDWINTSLPDAQQVKALILEAHFNETMAHRCLGMRLIGERFLRVADIESMYFVRSEGDPVSYIDESGAEQPVEEPTGGLILDSDGHAILNPFFDSRVTLIENSNRVSCGVTATEAQAALESAVTNGHQDVQVVMAYGDVGISMNEKVLELCNNGALSNDASKMAVFCSDATEANTEAIKKSIDNSSVLRGVMAAGDLVQTLCNYAAMLVNGESAPAYTMEPLSYVTTDATGNIRQVMYTDIEQLSPDITAFFPK